MEILQAILLGIVQGITEFIPVSSSGHLILFAEIFNIKIANFRLDVLLNFGTIAALLLYFRSKIEQIISTKDKKTITLLIIATVPAAVIGYAFENQIELVLRSGNVAAAMLIIVGFLMLIADRLSQEKELNSIDKRDSFIIGIAQALALIPGTSRSGITITAARFLKINREAAAEFSFLMAIPILLGASVKVLLEGETVSYVSANITIVLAGIIASFVSGYIAIQFMLRFLHNSSLRSFAYYRIILGVVVLLLISN